MCTHSRGDGDCYGGLANSTLPVSIFLLSKTMWETKATDGTGTNAEEKDRDSVVDPANC